MDADRSGFYCRSGASKREHTKYDQNKAYKSFKSSGLFKGFPIIQAVFKIDKLFSDWVNSGKHGLLFNFGESRSFLYFLYKTLKLHVKLLGVAWSCPINDPEISREIETQSD